MKKTELKKLVEKVVEKMDEMWVGWEENKKISNKKVKKIKK